MKNSSKSLFKGEKYKLISKSQTFWATMYVWGHLKILLYEIEVVKEAFEAI